MSATAFLGHRLALASLICLAVGQEAGGKGSSGAGAGAGAGYHPPPLSPAAVAAAAAAASQNTRYATDILIILSAMVSALGLYRLTICSVRYIRALTCLNNSTQVYFRLPPSTFGSIKQHILYAPLFRSRHNREFRLFSMYIGNLPTRLQAIFLLGIVAMNVSYCVRGIPWHGQQQEMLGLFRDRTGVLAVVNMIPLVLIAGRNNPLIIALNLSYDTFNLVHRFFGRVVAIQAVAHSIAHVAKVVDQGGWEAFAKSLEDQKMILSGFIGIVAVVVIMIQSISVLRHAFYEVFLHLHIALVILFILSLWHHLRDLPQRRYLTVVIVIWALERLIRLSSLVFRNFGRKTTRAIVEALPGDAVRVNIRLARPWHFRPGQYVFITIPSIGLWTSHPFSVAWSNEEDNLDSEKGLGLDQNDLLANLGNTVSLIVRRRNGFTDALHAKVGKSDRPLTVNAIVEGPYGTIQNLDSYGTVLLFAGGVGITHQVPFVRNLVAGYANGTVAARRVLLVWVIQSPEHLEWIRPWMTTILAMNKRRDILRIQLFVTQPRSTKELHSPSATVQMFPGKPNVDTLVQMECENQIGAMGVSVCGTGSMSDDVRNAVRRRQGWRNIDYFEESYSW